MHTRFGLYKSLLPIDATEIQKTPCCHLAIVQNVADWILIFLIVCLQVLLPFAFHDSYLYLIFWDWNFSWKFLLNTKCKINNKLVYLCCSVSEIGPDQFYSAKYTVVSVKQLSFVLIRALVRWKPYNSPFPRQGGTRLNKEAILLMLPLYHAWHFQ